MTRGGQHDLHAAPSAWPPDAPPLPRPPPAPSGPYAPGRPGQPSQPGRPDGPGGSPARGRWDPYAPPPYGADPETGSETGPAIGVDLDRRYGDTGVDELERSHAGHADADEDADDRDGDDGRRRQTGPKVPAPLDDAPRLPDVAGFDGLRALALIAVLLFHQGWDVSRGGFLGISSFFTLSGFLLATLALAEWAQTGRLALTRLWERRARRLVPAYVAVLALVIVLQYALRVGTGPGFRTDVLWGVGWATNWHAVVADQDVAGIFLDPSPVQHLWSLAVLAQLVVVISLLFVGLMKFAGRHWRLGGAAFGLVAVLSFLLARATAEVDGNGGLAYYGTHTRAGEVLVGVALAYAVLNPAMRRLLGTEVGDAAVRYGAVAALAGLAVLWSRTSLGDPKLFGGITALNAVLTAVVILAVTAPGPAATFLGTWPLRTLGRISYTAYLVHWPIYLLIDEPRLDLPGPALFGLRAAATLAVALALHVALEQPFRTRLRMPRPRLAGALVGATAVVLVAAVLVPLKPPVGVSLAIDDGQGPGDLDVVVPTGTEVASIALVGDALASSIAPGFAVWNEEHEDDQVRLDTHVTDDCPPGAPGPVRLAGETIGEQTACTGWEPRLPELLDATSADVVVVVTGLGELGDREIDGAWRHLGDPLYDSWLATQLGELADELADAGAPVLWAAIPHVRLPGADGDWTRYPENDPRRVDRYNELVRAAAEGHDLDVVDMTAWAQELPRGGEFSADYRQDGATFTEAGARVAAGWIAREVLRVIDP
jgi:peptidoglycan/LPS O-acetylase OafA/YrhL